MINAKELRIGNWYNFKNPMDGKFSPTQFTIWNDYLDFEAYGEPIPLTPEILVACGFTKEESSCVDERELYSIQVANNTSLYYDKDHLEKKWYLSHFYNNNHFQNDFWGCPESLHQLQNLYFALTQTEITINMK